MNQNTITDLQRIWNRLRIIALTLESAALEEGDVKEIGSMISDILVDEFQPAIEFIKINADE